MKKPKLQIGIISVSIAGILITISMIHNFSIGISFAFILWIFGLWLIGED